jgi:rubredoxin
LLHPQLSVIPLVYDPSDPEERQDFRWHACEADVPSERVCRLAALVHQQSLLDIDKLTVSREELRQVFNQNESVPLSPAECDQILDRLEKVRVRMVDDGEETDTYFIHE